MRLILGGIAFVLVGSLAACGGDSEGDQARSTKTAPAACELLTAEEREELAGTPVNHSVPVDSASGSYQCRWSTRADAPRRALVQVTSTPAHTWAEDLPAVISQFKESTPQIARRYKAQIDRVVKVLGSSEAVSDADACQLFSTMAEVNGGGEGATRLASFMEIDASTKAISAQTCTDGVFTSVVYGTPDLEPSASAKTAVFAALRRAHFKARQTR